MDGRCYFAITSTDILLNSITGWYDTGRDGTIKGQGGGIGGRRIQLTVYLGLFPQVRAWKVCSANVRHHAYSPGENASLFFFYPPPR